jgi:hypothetical protein
MDRENYRFKELMKSLKRLRILGVTQALRDIQNAHVDWFPAIPESLNQP